MSELPALMFGAFVGWVLATSVYMVRVTRKRPRPRLQPGEEVVFYDPHDYDRPLAVAWIHEIRFSLLDGYELTMTGQPYPATNREALDRTTTTPATDADRDGAA